ncbi:Wzz/FepE/Etk N-terminal domain-containing protein [Mucilaginibacter sp.]|uniref:Wzz/FepE/Etk N-terminal domain-containing protein n=1 Tax=Mucilaginibacter sp. TaxID=1882438 RepID=UPI00284F5847|nr:Wzz/FepE/Etk N-terminal domain-containing protein [Mucilaginibacter sp.]MDR3694917.1 Wzz/FepE/Etk N-terminal domain-containing protein [Mucilaginibacter sp.]
MDQEEQGKKTENPDEISIGDILLKVRSGIRYIKTKWLTILLFGVFGGLLGFGYSIIKKPVYTATCTFVLDEGNKSGGGLGQYAGLASLAGIDIGGSGGSIFSGDNIIELYKSRLMIEKTLLSEVDFNGKSALLIDRYINFNKLRTRWKEKDQIDSINFSGNPAKFTRKQDSIITDLVELFNKKVLSVDKPDKKLSIINVNVASTDELFAKEFTNKLVETVNDFYVQTKTKKTQQNVQILQRQADSVRRELNSSISGVASAIDAAPNANPSLLSLRVPSQRKQVDVQASTAIYAEIVKNLEISKISLLQETPLIQVIDSPVLPLFIDRVTKPKGIIVGAILGILFTVVCIAGRKVMLKLV